MPFRECENPTCRFRYADTESSTPLAYCPLCGASSPAITSANIPVANEYCANRHSGKPKIKVLVDNVRSIYNVGAIFRTSDGFGVDEILLCGITPTPDNSRFKKTSLGAEVGVSWSFHRNSLQACQGLKYKGFQIVSLECAAGSVNLYALSPNMLQQSMLLVVGNEVIGVDPGLLALSDLILSIPMGGTKNSFNVSCAHAIALSHLHALYLQKDRI